MSNQNLNTMKKLFFLAMLTLAALTAHAQCFDWVKSYSGQEPTGKFWNYIVSSVTDSHGNLYVAGQFANGAAIDGQDLLPFMPNGASADNPNAAIVKFSPNGQVVWKKVLHANDYAPCNITDIQIIGDSALYFMGQVCIPRSSDKYLYYLDTLITGDNGSPLLTLDGVSTNAVTIMAILDLDGNLLEHHFLQIAYRDENDNLVTLDRQSGNAIDTNIIVCDALQQGPFCIDREGNIYMGHAAVDMVSLLDDSVYNYHSVENGLLTGVVFIVDGQPRFCIYPQNTPTSANYRIVKFAPHFNTLLHFQYLFEGNTPWNSFETLGKMIIDSVGCLYVCNHTAGTTTNSECIVKDAPSLVLHTSAYQNTFLLKYDSTLIPIYIKQIEYGELAGDLRLIYRHGIFHSMTIDEDSSSIFVSSSVFNNNNEVFYIDSTEIELQKNAIVLRFDKETGRFVSYGYAKSSTMTTMRGRIPHYSSIICKKNRVFAPVAYQNDIQFQNQTINVEQSQAGKGIYIWDYNGAPLQYIDFNSATQQYAEPSTSLCLKDSILYISGYTFSDMTFGDISLNSNGHSLAYTAKYTDTAFMTPYVHAEEPGEVSITLVDDGVALVAYPNPFRQSVKIKVESGKLKVENGVATAWLTDLTGRREEVRLTPDGPNRYTLDLTSRPQATYLLTLTTADGRQHTVRLLKQSDIFGN